MEQTQTATRTCRKCGETKPLDEFDNRADTGRPWSMCKDCRRTYQRERWRCAHPQKERIPRRLGWAESFACTRCGLEKPADAFPRRRRGEPELQQWCRDCFAEANARNYVVNRSREIDRLRRNAEATRRENQERVLGYLLTHPCVDCGKADPVVLEFDHFRDKRRNISDLVNSGATWPRVMAEIEKCSVRCANCHRRASGQRAVIRGKALQTEFFWIRESDALARPDSAHERTRSCRRCDKAKPIAEFAFRSRASGKRHRICRPCQRTLQKQWYERSREKHIRSARRNRRRRRRNAHVARQRVWSFLAGHPCVDCGETDPEVLEFDHQIDKRAEIGALVRSGASWERVQREIAKCEVRCANCHRRRTSRNLGCYRIQAINTPKA